MIAIMNAWRLFYNEDTTFTHRTGNNGFLGSLCLHCSGSAKGRFEEVTEHAITGWAYDSDEPDEALNVNITIKNEETGKEVLNQSVKAGEFRQELLDDDKGNGNHGFTLNVDWPSFSDGSYIIEATVDGRTFSNTRTYTYGNSDTAKEEADSKPPLLSTL